MDFLLARGIQVANTGCVLCNSCTESLDHLFFNCGYTKWIWIKILRRFYLNLKQGSLMDMVKKTSVCFPSNSKFQVMLFSAFTASIWHIWSERNSRRFKNKKRHKTRKLWDILRDVGWRVNFNSRDKQSDIAPGSRILDFWLSFVKDARVTTAVQLCKWSSPPVGFVKLNMDGSLTSQGGGLRGILRNDMGEVIAYFHQATQEKNIMAIEAEAIHLRVQIALHMKASKVWIESDSHIVVDSLLHKHEIPWKIQKTCWKIKRNLSSLAKWEISHSWQEANRAADHLAKVGLTHSDVILWPVILHIVLGSIVREDRMGTLYPRH